MRSRVRSKRLMVLMASKLVALVSRAGAAMNVSTANGLSERPEVSISNASFDEVARPQQTKRPRSDPGPRSSMSDLNYEFGFFLFTGALAFGAACTFGAFGVPPPPPRDAFVCSFGC